MRTGVKQCGVALTLSEESVHAGRIMKEKHGRGRRTVRFNVKVNLLNKMNTGDGELVTVSLLRRRFWTDSVQIGP